MHDEDLFCKELADVPPVPSKAFSQIERKIKSKIFKKQIIFTIAATLILSTGVQIWFFTKQSLDTTASEWTKARVAPTGAVIPNEIADELQIARDFMNGDDLKNDTEQYAFLNNYDF
jgi:hypothetical protein